jgi:dTDP-4-amino-4,6-dideoxygalactose transaminase
MEWQVPLADLDYGVEEEDAVLSVLRSKWLTMGAVTRQFEDEFAKMCGVSGAISVSNATEALHLACLSLGIGKGDEVIVPSLSFVATANAVLYTGADVVFADIQGLSNLTISPEAIERKITEKTKAIIVMHYAGYPCDMPAIMQIAKKYNLSVIEDAAHAPGAFLDGRALGAWGDVGCFSFFSNKNLATGEGGMLVAENEEAYKKINQMRSHGMTTLTYDRHQGHAYTYDVVALGFNYRIDEIRSALGLSQLKKLLTNNKKREMITNRYKKALKDVVPIPFMQYQGQPAFHIFPIILPERVSRNEFQNFMKEKLIQTSIHYPPIHTFTYYKERYGNCNDLLETEAVGKHEVTLPLFPSMSEGQIDYVIDQVKTFMNRQ